MKDTSRFPRGVVDALQSAKILGVRAGDEHRFTGVWPVVVDGRLFVRTWNDKPTGWYRALVAARTGAIQVGQEELAVRAKVVRSERVRRAVTLAYGEKYPTKGSRKWVEGFADPAREQTTLELEPR